MDSLTRSNMITDLTVTLRKYNEEETEVFYLGKPVYGFDVDFEPFENIVVVKPLDEDSGVITQ
jgi:hypothetical protein